MATAVTQHLRAAWATWWSPRLADSEGQPLWAMVTVTFLWNAAIGLALTAFAWVFSGGRLNVEKALWINLITAQCIGFSIFGLFLLVGAVIGGRVIDQWRGLRRALFFSLVPLLGLLIGYALSFALFALIDENSHLRWVSGWWVSAALMIWAVCSFIFWRFYKKELQIAETKQQLALDRARSAELERQAASAQLRALQAQIEPHFLFNTLANVQSLIDTQPQDARHMLERLIALLRGSLSASRAERATLGQEFDLCSAYLDILAIRMGGRLHYTVEIAPALRALPVPPMLLQPVVENAIQHGLEPKVEGGHVLLRAVEADDMVELTVQDDGVGFAALTRGGGVGLSNLRERLAALFEGRARLVIEDAQSEDAQSGTRVRLLLPMVSLVSSPLPSSLPARGEPAQPTLAPCA
jgi:signal transduction histidine kinase